MEASSFLKKLFSKASEEVDSLTNQAEDLATETITKAKEATAPLLEKVDNFAESAKEKVNEYSPSVEEAMDAVKAKVNEYADKTEEFAKSTTETVMNKINEFTTPEETAKKIEKDSDKTS